MKANFLRPCVCTCVCVLLIAFRTVIVINDPDIKKKPNANSNVKKATEQISSYMYIYTAQQVKITTAV